MKRRIFIIASLQCGALALWTLLQSSCSKFFLEYSPLSQADELTYFLQLSEKLMHEKHLNSEIAKMHLLDLKTIFGHVVVKRSLVASQAMELEKFMQKQDQFCKSVLDQWYLGIPQHNGNKSEQRSQQYRDSKVWDFVRQAPVGVPIGQNWSTSLFFSR
jgi:hypothetical protein